MNHDHIPHMNLAIGASLRASDPRSCCFLALSDVLLISNSETQTYHVHKGKLYQKVRPVLLMFSVACKLSGVGNGVHVYPFYQA